MINAHEKQQQQRTTTTKETAQNQDTHTGDKGKENVQDTLTGDTINRHACRLPNEIVSLVINIIAATHYQRHGTLRACALVSKQFHVFSNPLLWQQPTLYHNDDANRRFLVTLCNAPASHRQQALGGYVEELELTTDFWTDARLMQLLPLLRRLQHLTVDEASSISDASFKHVPRHCPAFASLRLVGDLNITRPSFRALARTPNFDCLDLYRFHHLSPECLAPLVSCRLENLRIISPVDALDMELVAVIKKFNHLKRLELINPAFLFYQDPNMLLLSNTTTTTSTTPWPQLAHLNFEDVNDIKDTTWQQFFTTHPHLKTLRLTHAQHLDDTNLDAMAACLPDLANLVLQHGSHITPPVSGVWSVDAAVWRNSK